MPVFDPRQGQVLFSPVTNYYRGQAIRQDAADKKQMAELRGLQIDSAKEELADAPRKRKQEEAMLALQYANMVSTVQKRTLEIGEKEMSAGRDVWQPFVKKYGEMYKEDPVAAGKWANANLAPAIKRLPESQRAASLEAINKDGNPAISHSEISALGLMTTVADAEDPNSPTSHKKNIDALVAAEHITQEQGNEMLKAIEVKAGTITGTTEHDPRSTAGRSREFLENKNKYSASSDVQELISSALPRVNELPGAVGARGAIGVGGAGFLSTLGQDEMAEAFAQYMSGVSPAEATQIQTQLQVLRGRIIPIVTGEQGKRLSEMEREIASKAVGLIDSIKGPADLTKSYPQVMGAMRQLYAESWVTQYNVANRDEDIPYPYDLSNKDQRIELFTEFSEADVDIDTAKRTMVRLKKIQGAE